MLAREGYRSHVSDLVQRLRARFILLTDCTVELIDGDVPGTRHHSIAISRGQIVIANPSGEVTSG